MIIKNNAHPDGKKLPPDRRKSQPLPCVTRQMTADERLIYGEPEKTAQTDHACKLSSEKQQERQQRLEYLETGVMPQEVVDISRRVKEVRKANGLKQSDFAALAGISQKTVSDLEGLRKFPRPKTIKKAEECLRNFKS